MKVLFATDFSECCMKTAFAFLMKLKEVIDEVVVVHVINEREIKTIVTNTVWIGETTEEWEEELREKLRKKALEEMGKLKEKLESEGFRVKDVIEEGHPADKIVEIAEKEDVDFIIIGSHGKSNIKAALIGSVSESVAKKAKKPVVIVRREVNL